MRDADGDLMQCNDLDAQSHTLQVCYSDSNLQQVLLCQLRTTKYSTVSISPKFYGVRGHSL